MSKIDFGTILTKIAYVFKKDVYIIDYRYCMGGEESESENVGNYLCELNENTSVILKEIFPNSEIIYFSDIKKAKKDLNAYSSTEIGDDIKEKINNRKKTLLKELDNVKKWKDFPFTEELLHKIFKNGETVELFTDDDSIPSITISKTLFPLVTEKKYDSLVYSISWNEDDTDELCKFITSFDTEILRLYGLFYFISLD